MSLISSFIISLSLAWNQKKFYSRFITISWITRNFKDYSPSFFFIKLTQNYTFFSIYFG